MDLWEALKELWEALERLWVVDWLCFWTQDTPEPKNTGAALAVLSRIH